MLFTSGHTSMRTWLAPAGYTTGPSWVTSKRSNVSASRSVIVSDVTGVDVDEALRMPSVIVLASPDWATADPSAQSFVATGEGRTGMSTSMSAESVTVLVLLPERVAVLVTTLPSVNGVSTGSRIPISTWRDCPAGIPVLPAGFGGLGSGIV